MPTASQKNGVDLEIIFEAGSISGAGPVMTNKLDRLHVNNWLEDAELSLDQFTAPGASPCAGITNAVDVRYTMDHELVLAWAVGISTSAPIVIPTLAGNAVPPVPPNQLTSPRGGNGIAHVDTSTFPQCAYSVTFTRKLKLTDGENDDPGRGGTVAVFCKR
jgi:hypothetical protein